MDIIEAVVYIIGFFTIWGATAGLVWSIDNWIIAPIFGRTLIPREFWK